MSDPNSMRVSELKDELKAYGITDLRHCVEKSDLVKELLAARSKGPVPAPAPAADTLTYGRAAVVGNASSPTGLVLFLHGLGDTCDGWASELRSISRAHPHLLFVLPTAAHQPVSMNMGMSMPSWYDIKSLDLNGPEDLDGMQRSSAYVARLISEYRGKHASIAPDRVVLSGFSQGGCISLFTGLTNKALAAPPAGIACLSGYMGSRQWVCDNAQHRGTPIFMAHGRQDPVVTLPFSQLSRKLLAERIGVTDLEYHEYDMGHSALPEELKAFSAWIGKMLPAA